jgi:hypothetical protein
MPMPAGFVMTMDSPESIARSVADGVYGTFRNQPDGHWGGPGYGTFGDYASMKPGDNIYFFHDRQIYGIGELVDVGGACAHLNYVEAAQPHPVDYASVRSELLYDVGEESVKQRWLTTFRPSPLFFSAGVDMDEALSAHPEAFRMLRVMWKLSFIKLDYEENAALKDVLLRANRHSIPGVEASEGSWTRVHAEIASRRTPRNDLQLAPMLSAVASHSVLRSEKAIEAAFLYYLTNRDAATSQVFGNWDYVSHQVAASPFKPPDWMDKIDVFGARFIPGHAPVLAGLLVAELKKDIANGAFVEQTMKYVDWVKDEYAHLDYSLIRAFLVASDFDQSALTQHQDFAVRRYTVGRRPPRSEEWRDLTLVRYTYDATAERLDFQVVA